MEFWKVKHRLRLTPRERDCLTYLAIGLRPQEICWRLKISEKTFEKYVRGAKDKLRARTRDHAIRLTKATPSNALQAHPKTLVIRVLLSHLVSHHKEIVFFFALTIISVIFCAHIRTISHADFA